MMRPDLDQRKLVPHPFDCSASTAFKMNPERFFIRQTTSVLKLAMHQKSFGAPEQSRCLLSLELALGHPGWPIVLLNYSSS